MKQKIETGSREDKCNKKLVLSKGQQNWETFRQIYKAKWEDSND